jgi:hypothetical protein
MKDFNFLQIFLSALLFSVFNEFIRGANVDIIAPILNKILPGDVRNPVKVFGVDFFLTRFVVRVINMVFALYLVFCITKQSKNNKTFKML